MITAVVVSSILISVVIIWATMYFIHKAYSRKWEND